MALPTSPNDTVRAYMMFTSTKAQAKHARNMRPGWTHWICK